MATVFPSQISFFEAKIKGRGRVARPPGHTQGSLGRPRRRGRNQDYDKRPRSGFSLSTTLVSHPTITHPSQPCTSSRHTEIHPWSPIQENHPQNFITPTPSLFSPLYSSQERWPEPPHHRPFIPQYPFDNTYLQNGTCLPNSLLHSGTDVGLHSGPTGRFLPCSCGLVFPHFPCIRGGRPDLCFPSPPIWSVDRPLGIFQGDEARQGIHPQDPNQFPYLSGRFPHSSGFQGISGFSHPIHSFSPPTAGSPYKLQEVTPHSLPDHRVPRGNFPSRHPSPFSPCLKGTKDHLSLPKHSPQTSNIQASPGEPGRLTEFRLLLPPSRTYASETSGELDELEHLCRDKRFKHYSGLRSSSPHSAMDQRDLLEDSSSHVSPNSTTSIDDRRFQIRLGRDHDSSFSIGDMATFIPVLFHKLARTPSNLSLSQTFSSFSQRPLHSASLRQHHGNSLHSPSRYLEVGLTHGSDRLNSRILLTKLHHSYSQTPQWLSECLSRSKLPSRTHLHRMVNRPEDILLDMQYLRYPSDRPLCHQGESQTSSLCLSMPRSGRSGLQRSLHPVGSLELSLPLSSSSSSSEGVVPPSKLPRAGVSDCSLLCSIKLAPQPSPQVPGPSSSSVQSFPVAEDQQRSGAPSQPLCLSPSRVETIRQGLLKAGFNASAADVYLLSHRASSTRQYQSIWTKFLSYLSVHNISFSNVSVGVVCNYLAHEATVNKLMYRTVSGYRSALNLPLYWSCGLEIKNAVSNQFLRGLFNLKPPIKAAPMPIWNINVLLSFLQSEKFEPIETASFTALVQKTLCLILLSSGGRISDVTYLTRSYVQAPDKLSITLDWDIDFRSKMDGPKFRSPKPVLSYLASDHSTDLSLCPVRAYTKYLSISQTWLDHLHPSNQHQFFWAQPNKSTPLTIRNLTSLFIKVVKASLLDAGLPLVPKIGPHQMRKLSASLAHKVGQVEDTVRKRMGFSSVTVLRKNYVGEVPSLNIACVLPGGPYFPPGDAELSDSDSD